MTPPPHYDGIIVLLGGEYEDGSLKPNSIGRLDAAIAAYERGESGIIIPSSQHTVGECVALDEKGQPRFEATEARNYLVSQGIPPTSVFPEDMSRDTIGNFYFCRTMHVDPLGLSKLLVVTEEFHIPRASVIADKVFSLMPRPEQGYALEFRGIPDMVEPEVVRMFQERDLQAIERFRNETGDITMLADFHRYLYSMHNAYNGGAVTRTAAEQAFYSTHKKA